MGQHDSTAAYEQIEKDYVARNPKSKAVYDKAVQSLPGGNTRTSIFYKPFPVSIERAEGARLYDVDGHAYIDLLGEFTAGLYGHSEPVILAAISKSLQQGLSYGGHHEGEGKLAELVKARFPSMELLRFTNSGTEANLMAIAAAVKYTNKKKIMVVSGAYHGGAFIFKGGKSYPINAPYEYIIARYNDINSVSKLLNDPENKNKVAVIIVEPMIGSGGAIPAEMELLKQLRSEASAAGAVLIYDEVMTSRMHQGGGIQSQLDASLRPDLTTLGKYIGGGMSFGAFGGSREIMEMFDPRKPDSISHAGTFNNNVLTMSAGIAGLQEVFTPDRASKLHAMGEHLRKSLVEASNRTIMKVTGCGSMLHFHFIDAEYNQLRSPEDLASEDRTLSDLLHLFLIERGYYTGRSGFMALSLALTEEDLASFVEAVGEFLRFYEPLLIKGHAQNGVNGH